MAKKIWKDEEITESTKFLHTLFSKTDTVYTVLYYVSRSGMKRLIKLYVCADQIIDITYHAAVVLNEKLDKWGTIKMTGVGSDVGYDAVFNLSYALFRDGYKLKHKWL